MSGEHLTNTPLLAAVPNQSQKQHSPLVLIIFSIVFTALFLIAAIVWNWSKTDTSMTSTTEDTGRQNTNQAQPADSTEPATKPITTY